MKANRKIHPRTLHLLAFGSAFAGSAIILLTSALFAAEVSEAQKALQAFYASKPAVCRERAEVALRAKPKDAAEWHAVLAQSAAYTDPRFGLTHIEAALALEPKNCRYIARKAFLQLEEREMLAAGNTAGRALAICPTNPLALAVLASCEYSRGEVGAAQAGFAKALLNDDDQSEFDVLLLAVSFYERTSDNEQAHHCMEILTKRYPNSSQVVFARAILERNADGVAPALKDFARAFELDPTNTRPISLRGNLLMRVERYREAIADYNKVIAKTASPEVWGRLADCYRALGDDKRAIEYYEQAIARSNGPSIKSRIFSQKPLTSAKTYKMNWLRQTQLFEKIGEDDKAIANASEILRVDPLCPTALQIRQGIYLKRRQYAKAISDLTVLIKLDPDVSAWHTARGKAYKELNESSKAEADFAQAKHIDQFGK